MAENKSNGTIELSQDKSEKADGTTVTSAERTSEQTPMSAAAEEVTTKTEQIDLNEDKSDPYGSDSEDEAFVDALDELVKNNEAANEHRRSNTRRTLKHEEVKSEEDNSENEDVSSDDKAENEIIADEVALKEMEDSLTDEQKLERKDEAQALKTEGNVLFKAEDYREAADKYTEALRICPSCFQKERSIMYSNRAACKLRLEQYEGAIEDSTKALELNPNYLKALLRRAELYEKTDKLDEALEDYQKVVNMDPSQHAARHACMRLPDQIKERNEKLKEEMLGKLKELGNMVLKPFGLSTDNFKLQQDPNSGGYSVNFQQGGKPK